MTIFNIGDKVKTIRLTEEGRAGPPIGAEGVVLKFGSRMGLENKDRLQIEFAGNWHLQSDPSHTRWWLHKDNIDLADEAPKAFYLVTVRDGKIEALKDERGFDSGREADERARELTAILGYKVQPRRIAADAKSTAWRLREQQRLDDGTYHKLPETWDLEPIADHFLHLSQDNPEMVSYTENPEKGVMDRQTRVKPGRYLEKFYPHLTDGERKRYIAMVDKGNAVQFTKDPSVIEQVYQNGPDSCMKKPLSYFESFCHPVRAYGNGDLALAYLKDEDDRITARAIVWPDKKIASRMYGDEHRLEVALAEQGYEFSEDDEHSLDGARVKKIWDTDLNCYVLPYLDWNHELRDEPGDFLVIDSDKGTISARSQRGRSSVTTICAKTGQRISEDDDSYEVFVDENGTTETWCEDAVDDYAVNCDGRYYLRKLLMHVDGGWIPKAEVETKCFKSAVSGNWCKTDSSKTLHDGRRIGYEEAYDIAYFCNGHKKYYLKKEHPPVIKEEGWSTYFYSPIYLEEIEKKKADHLAAVKAATAAKKAAKAEQKAAEADGSEQPKKKRTRKPKAETVEGVITLETVRPVRRNRRTTAVAA